MSGVGRRIMVLMESMAGTGHKRTLIRYKTEHKAQKIAFDPIVRSKVLYNEIKKLKTVKQPKKKKQRIEAI